MVSKFNAHHKEIRFAASLLPVSKLVLETGTFDPHALKNPQVLVDKSLYQKGTNFGSWATFLRDRTLHLLTLGSLAKHRVQWGALGDQRIRARNSNPRLQTWGLRR